ncbi:dihydrofolate reductase family protein [Elizabethkingia ursingii]|uniref:dihydrofolate reductase family protein n=1 Tax=Elizabethkingia ursingii TaxID=1756150 RepID=UPI002011FB87|nr:dihydrofolate reductase family protein [Elizabethkingia ursingii]MCL1668296.1 dihydrofolate reductase family protein [Elizabethkingia ursingii]
MNTRKLILYISYSLDGYIAQSGDDLSFLEKVQREGEDYGYNDFTATVDTVIMGRRTYDWILNQGVDFPHQDKESYIITRTERPSENGVNFYNGNLRDLIVKLKSENGKNIFCDGGAEIVNELLKEKLFDELIISVIPVLLGNGIRLFKEGIPAQDLALVSSKSFESGLMQLHYKIN